MKKVITFLMLAAMFAMTPAHAVVVQSGLKTPFLFTTDKTSKTAVVGDRLQGILLQDIVVGGVPVFKKGAEVVGIVSAVEKTRFLGKPGSLVLTDGTVKDANGVAHGMKFNYATEGQKRTLASALLTVGLIKGGDAKLPKDTAFEGITTSSFTFNPAK